MNIWSNRTWKPMLLIEVDKPFNDPDYYFEIKFDGIRAKCFVTKNEIQILSRNNQDLTSYFPELKDLTKLVNDKVIFDGELVAFNNLKPSFKDIMMRIRIKNKTRIATEASNNPIVFVAFDILYKNKDLTTLPLKKRKEILNKYPDKEVFTKTKYIESDGVRLFKEIKKLNLEGIVAKKIESPYHINKRTNDFIKIKNLHIDDFYIGGFEYKKNDIISLALGEIRENKFNYVGKVAISKKKSIYKDIINTRESKKNYFSNFSEEIHYLKPTIKIRIEYLEKTKSGMLRHPKYKDF